MKVKELIDELKEFDGNLPVGFATCPGENLHVLSVYDDTLDQPTRKPTHVWIDLGDDDED